MQNMSPILVVGRNGQLARAMMALANESRLPIVAYGRPELDLRDAGAIRRIVVENRPQAIVNAAAYTMVDKAESEAEAAFEINRDGPAYLAAAASELCIPLIHISTDYVFDGTKTTPYRENDKTSPLNIYGRSKLEGESAVLQNHSGAVVLRTSWVYSVYGQNFVKTMLRLGATRDLVKVVDDQRGAPTLAEDLAAAILKIIPQLASRGKPGGVYHLTAAGETSWHGFAAAIFEGWAKRGEKVPTLYAIKTIDYPTAARRPAYSLLDCSKAAAEFGVKLRPWQQALDQCLDGLRAELMSVRS